MNVVSPVAINVPVTDIDRALDLYRDCLGFSTLADRGSAALREVTMLAPGGAVAIQLAQGNHERPAGSLREAVLPVRDLASTLGCLRWAGFTEHWVDPDAPGGPAALFTDADGNAWTLWQPVDAPVRLAA
jgi:catechol 2,3-dioxygenase-like lactoylglutathione lyase family enzyme